jgi:hypothetical protein
MASSPTTESRVFSGRGLSPLKRNVTIVGLLALTGAVLVIALHEGASVIGSTIAALLFIAGFVYYLRIIAPVPFTITLEPELIVKRDQHGEEISVRWEDLTRIKEEFFPNGKRISVAIYRNTTTPEQKARAWVVYRDDVDNLDALTEALKSRKPAGCAWESETVHE